MDILQDFGVWSIIHVISHVVLQNFGSIKNQKIFLHIGVLNCSQLSIVDKICMGGSVFGGILYYMLIFFCKVT